MGEPEIFSEGVIPTEMSLLLDKDIRTVVKESLYRQTGSALESTNLENIIRDEVSTFLVHRTGRKPIIIPVVVKVGG
jgi:mRNA degradation ribonuclease J1/J2